LPPAQRAGAQRLCALARLRHPEMSAIRSLSGEKRTSRGQPISVANDPRRTLSKGIKARRSGPLLTYSAPTSRSASNATAEHLDVAVAGFGPA
jgi:hypothetical protein